MAHIYTKTGDKGTTSLLGGTRVSKHHVRLECYGTADELNSHIGLIRDSMSDAKIIALLERIQHILFVVGSDLANEKAHKKNVPVLSHDEIVLIEQAIDEISQELPTLRNFILPGGHPFASYCHIARTVCRRLERLVSKLTEEVECNENTLIYINRLSDFLFVLARKVLKDFNKSEITWSPIL